MLLQLLKSHVIPGTVLVETSSPQVLDAESSLANQVRCIYPVHVGARINCHAILLLKKRRAQSILEVRALGTWAWTLLN